MEDYDENSQSSNKELEIQNDDEQSKNENLSLYNTNYDNERLFWEEHKFFFYPPTICPNCKKDSIRNNIFKSRKILQPIGLRCINKKCKKRLNYRNFSFFKLHPKIHCSVIYVIMKLFLIEKKNGKEIFSYFSNKYENFLTGFPELDDLAADDCVELLEEDDLVEDDPVAEDPEVEVLFTDELVTGFPEEVELLVELFELDELVADEPAGNTQVVDDLFADELGTG